MTARLDAIRFGIEVVECCVLARQWGDAQHYARAVRRMIDEAVRRISGRRQHAKGQGGIPPNTEAVRADRIICPSPKRAGKGQTLEGVEHSSLPGGAA